MTPRFPALVSLAAALAVTLALPTTSSAGSAPRAPHVTLAPASITVHAGASAHFVARSAGSPTPNVQWQVAFAGSTAFVSVPRAHSNTFVVFDAFAPMSGERYRAVFTNRYGRAVTAAATLRVLAAAPSQPHVTLAPVNVSAPASFVATFFAAASGSPAPAIQWQVALAHEAPFVSIPGATSATYSLATVEALNGTQYRAVFTNAAGRVTSSSATLSVTPLPTLPPITTTTLPVTTTTSPGTPTTLPTTPSTTTTTTPTPPEPSGAVPSTNWSGYVDTGDTFSSVQAAWVVPAASCNGLSSSSSIWVGIDGSTDSSVEQDGTAADCSFGQLSYYAWYEMYGDMSTTCNCNAMVPLDPSKYPVMSGDSIDAAVAYAGGVWTLVLRDTTENWNFSTVIDSPVPAPERSSAEWIAERPSVCLDSACTAAAVAFLTPQGPVTFTGAQAAGVATTGSVSAFAFSPIEMVNGFSNLDTPSTLSPDGSSFSVTQ